MEKFLPTSALVENFVPFYELSEKVNKVQVHVNQNTDVKSCFPVEEIKNNNLGKNRQNK